MLTVTICAPLAAIASRMMPKSLYFPVPTMRRESKDLPPITNLSSRISASLRHRHDLDDVLLVQFSVGDPPGAIDLVAVHHHDHPRVRLHLVEQPVKRQPRAV